MEGAQEELHHLGFIGIIKESFKIIFKWKKIFTQITFSLILPLSSIFLAHILISRSIFFNIHFDQGGLVSRTSITPTYSTHNYKVSSIELAIFIFYEIAYRTFLLLFSLLSISTIAYTIACIYTSKEITFKKVFKAVPKVWKRLVITVILSFVIVFVYNIIAIALIYLDIAITDFNIIGIVIFFALLLVYTIGFVYIGVIWHLACVVSVLEDVKGFKALKKSKELIKGKTIVASSIFFLLCACLVATELVFDIIVLYEKTNFMIRVGVGILCLSFLFKIILCGLVIQTVIYFVCKSYHHETIDRNALSYHLEVIHLGKHIPPKPMDVQLQQSQFQSHV